MYYANMQLIVSGGDTQLDRRSAFFQQRSSAKKHRAASTQHDEDDRSGEELNSTPCDDDLENGKPKKYFLKFGGDLEAAAKYSLSDVWIIASSDTFQQHNKV